jgi:hypothetical protein
MGSTRFFIAHMFAVLKENFPDFSWLFQADSVILQEPLVVSSSIVPDVSC